jgi:hypothetical protein
MYEKDFLRGYELRNWNFSPRLYKIIGVSALVNLLAVFVFAQTNLLTRKGCDSPFVSTICQVLDTVYVSKTILGMDSGYVDNPDYIASNLGDAEITFIDVTSETPPLSYPAGYFPLANPEQYITDADGNVIPMQQSGFENVTTPNTYTPMPPPTTQTPPIIVNKTPPTLRDTKPVYPKPRKDVVVGDLPSKRSDGEKAGGENSSDIDGKTADKNPDKNKTDEPDKNKVDPNTAKDSDAVADVEINRVPIQDLGKYVNKTIKENKEFSLQTPFLVQATGRLNKDGRFDEKTFRFVKAESTDEKMIEVVKESIEAIDAAGYLKYLKKFDGKDLDLLLQQDEKGISAVVQSEFENKERANSIKNLLDLAIAYSKTTKTDPNDMDDLELLNSAKIETDGKKIIIKFVVPNPKAQEMIKRKLLEQEQKEKTKEGKTSASQTPKSNAQTGK